MTIEVTSVEKLHSRIPQYQRIITGQLLESFLGNETRIHKDRACIFFNAPGSQENQLWPMNLWSEAFLPDISQHHQCLLECSYNRDLIPRQLNVSLIGECQILTKKKNMQYYWIAIENKTRAKYCL